MRQAVFGTGWGRGVLVLLVVGWFGHGVARAQERGGWYETRFVDSRGVPVTVAALESAAGFNSLGRRVVLTVSCYAGVPSAWLHWDEPLAGDGVAEVEAVFVSAAGARSGFPSRAWPVRRQDWATRAPATAAFLEALVRGVRLEVRTETVEGEALRAVFAVSGAPLAIGGVIAACREARRGGGE